MSITAERLMVEVQADVRQALSQLDRVEAKAASSAGRLSKMAKTMGLAFGGAAIVGGIKKTVTLAMDFDATMRQIGVQTDQTGKSLKSLGDLALKMGKDTVFSAQDASGAMLELAKGGLGAAEIRAGALESTLKLAAAGGLDLANAAGYITQGMTTFGLGAGKADTIVTALAGGANASTASVESLGQALSQVGPGARNAGFSIQDTVAALAAFDNAGIKGSDAGTSLKTALQRLVPTTKQAREEMSRLGLDFVKGNGDFENLANISEQLKDKLGGLSEAERTVALTRIFGSDATRAATVLMNNGRKGIEKYQRAVRDSNKAQEMANSTMEGAKGAWENFTGAAETAAIQIGTKLLPAFTSAAETGADWITTMSGWGPQIKETFGWVPELFKGMASAMSPVVDLVKTMASAWSGLPGPVKAFAAQGALAALIFPRLAAAATAASGRVVSTFTVMGAKARQFAAEMSYAQTRTAAMGRVARTAAGPAGMAALMVGATTTNEKVKALSTTLGGAAIGFSMGGPLGAAIGGLGGGLMGLKGYMDSTRSAADKTWDAIREAGGPVESAKASLGDLKGTLDQVTGAFTGATRAAVLHKLEQQGLIEKAAGFGISSREMVNAAMGQAGAMKNVASVVGDYRARLVGLREQQRLLREERDNMGGRVTPQWAEAMADVQKRKAAMKEEIATLKQMPGALRSQAKAVRDASQATADYTGKLKGIPARKRTKIEAEGIPPTVKGVADLAKKYNLLDRKKVKTLVEATGADLSIKKIMNLIEKTREAGRQKAKPKTDVDTSMSDKKLERLYEKLRETARQTARPSADLKDNATPSLQSLNAFISRTDGRTITITTRYQTVGSPGGGGGGGGGGANGRMAAGSGGAGGAGMYDSMLPTSARGRGPLEDAKKTVDDWVKKLTPAGQKLAEALLAGFTGTAERINGQVDRYLQKVNDSYDKRIEAIRNRGGKKAAPAKKGETDAEQKAREAANKALESQNKKREAEGERHIKALEKERDRLIKAAEKYRERVDTWKEATSSLTDGFGESWDDARGKMAEIRKAVVQTFSGKAEARWLKVVDAANRQLQGLYARRVDLAGRLEEANRQVADLQQEKAAFMDSVSGGMTSQGTVLNAGNSAGAIATNLQTQVAKVKEFAALLGQLRGMGYNDAIVMQVASAGVEGGMQAARALAAASGSEMASVNDSMAQITAVATQTASALGGGLFDAGISSAQQLAHGLQSELATVDAQIQHMAFALHQTMQAELRSGLTKAGRQAGQGLIDGLKEKKGPLGEAAAAMGRELVRALRDELQIKSPSRVALALGRFVPLGLAKGILADVPKVGDAAAVMGRAAIPSMGTVPTPDALNGGLRAGSSVTFNFITHNPRAEPQSWTTNRALAEVAALGLV